MPYYSSWFSGQNLKESISSEKGCHQKESFKGSKVVYTNFSFVVPSSEELWVRKEMAGYDMYMYMYNTKCT